MTKHTPGPWCCNVPPRKFPIYTENKRTGFTYIAVTVKDDETTAPEMDANARLISASPELLEALQEALTWMTLLKASDPGITDHGPLSRSIDKAHAAIAKATA